MTLVAVAILAAAMTLRPGATSVGPVLAEISTGLGLSSGTAGLVTALPGFMFALGGVAAVPLSRRLGVGATIGTGLLLTAACLLARPYVGSAGLFVLLSALALIGMAVGNVLVPAVIRIFGRDKPAFLAGIYSTGLAVGGAAPLLVAGLLLAATGGWQPALATWGLFSLMAAVVWGVLMARSAGRLGRVASARPAAGPGAATSQESAQVAAHGRPVWRSRTAVALALFFGLQSTNAYIQFGWMSQIYRDAGLSLGTASVLVGMIAFLGVPGGFATSWMVSNSRHLAGWIIGMGACMVLGYGGLLLAPATVPLLWALLLGLGSLAFPTALALITARTRDPAVTARVSGFIQPAGYLMAGAGPLLIGLIHGWTGSWTVPLLLLLASSFPLAYFGSRVANSGYIDDELLT